VVFLHVADLRAGGEGLQPLSSVRSTRLHWVVRALGDVDPSDPPKSFRRVQRRRLPGWRVAESDLILEQCKTGQSL